jgi:LysM repeat protein
VTLLPLWANGETDAVTSAVLVPDTASKVARVDVCALFPTACLPDDGEVETLLARDVATLSPSAAPADEPVITAEPTPTREPLPTMTVRQGDTLVALANWFGVTPFDIASVNGFAVDDYLQIGWVLAIPVDDSEFSVPPDPMAAVAAAVEPEPVAAPAPVAQPQPTPVPVTPPPYIPRSSEEIIAAICALPWPCETMVRIASCESGLNPRAYNPAGYYGLFQISNNIENWDDPVVNANFAYYNKYLPALARGNGLSPWPVCQYY